VLRAPRGARERQRRRRRGLGPGEHPRVGPGVMVDARERRESIRRSDEQRGDPRPGAGRERERAVRTG
jgi:hypothetical protein